MTKNSSPTGGRRKPGRGGGASLGGAGFWSLGARTGKAPSCPALPPAPSQGLRGWPQLSGGSGREEVSLWVCWPHTIEGFQGQHQSLELCLGASIERPRLEIHGPHRLLHSSLRRLKQAHLTQADGFAAFLRYLPPSAILGPDWPLATHFTRTTPWAGGGVAQKSGSLPRVALCLSRQQRPGAWVHSGMPRHLWRPSLPQLLSQPFPIIGR